MSSPVGLTARPLALMVSLCLTLSACSDGSPTTSPLSSSDLPTVARAEMASTSAPSPSQARYEIDFMEDMIDHHHMAIMMAELCVEKAVHAELRELCTQIIAAQQAEIIQMQSWLQTWYGITYQPQMKPGDMKMMERMAAMTGAEFEIAFMEMMIKHHSKAVKEGEHCLDRAYHPELRTLCQDIVQTQTAEIALMQSWLCSWYGICR
jgi:uncharacterized protein (DUF305 family)